MPLMAPQGNQVSSWEGNIRAMEREWEKIALRQTRALLADWRSTIRSMEHEWCEIAARRTKTLLAEWHEAMAEMRCQQDRLVSDGLWLTGPSDFLDIVGLARHENTHSRMLAWLLMPTARDGFGTGQALLGTLHRRDCAGATGSSEGGVF